MVSGCRCTMSGDERKVAVRFLVPCAQCGKRTA
jgi:hypothetical protein